jgi:myo-inositol-1-phosphate synthase
MIERAVTTIASRSSVKEDRKKKTGVWIIGALGDVATTTVLGAHAIAERLAPPTGLVTGRAPFTQAELIGLDRLVFGGHDIRSESPLTAAKTLAASGVIPHTLVEACTPALEAYGDRIRPGVTFGGGKVVARLEGPKSRERRESGPAKALEAIRSDLRAFRADNDLERVVVVALASTELKGETPDELETAAGVRKLVAADDPRIPASTLYALAAFEEGCAYVNFTPSLGANSAGLHALAEELGVPHMGCDGKTGETLLRTVLAPMFLARNFNVLSWSGFNILGNRDGEVLDEPAANAAKSEGKDSVLSKILGDSLGTSLTRIDYVPSLQDWKTAWDFIHFEGFLGARMHLEFTWKGADSALAAPLVLDLVRLMDRAAELGKTGLQTGLACFFKTPLGVEEYSFPKQMVMLEDYAASLRISETAS